MMIWFSLLASSLALGGTAEGSHHRDMSSPTITSPQGPTATFPTSWSIPTNITLLQKTTIVYAFEQDFEPQVYGTLWLNLCQTNASGADLLDASNTWTVLSISGCTNADGPDCKFSIVANETRSFTFNSTGPSNETLNLSNFFFCFGTAAAALLSNVTCESFSPYFNIHGSAVDPPIGAAPEGDSYIPLGLPTTPLPLTQNEPVVQILGAQPPNKTPSPFTTSTISTSYITVSSTAVAAPSAPASSSVSTASVQSESKGGLSIGTKVGIAVGGTAVAIIALLALVALRLQHRRNSKRQPEDAMLTLSAYTESRDLISEKEPPGSRESDLETPPSQTSFTPNPRHSYDSLNTAAPYSGRAAAIPQRNPAPSSLAVRTSLLSCELSVASAHVSPRSIVRGAGDDIDEPYQDDPVFGDARHVPQFYQSTIQAPFLSEPGMTAEEISRLEEEERRIDAAIAEAESR